MSGLLENIRSFLENSSDERTKDWFLVNSWWSILSVLSAYLLFCPYLGPKLMKDRKAIDVQTFLFVYNLIILALNAVLAASFMYYMAVLHYSPLCQPNNPIGYYELMLARVFYVYFMSKAFELLDSVVLVLKKKGSHQNFLHFFHHSSMLFITWLGIKYLPSGSSSILATINSIFHFIRYLYYHAVAFDKWGWFNLDSLRNFTAWLQIFQFGIAVLHCLTTVVFSCGYPRTVALSVAIYILSFVGLFFCREWTMNSNNRSRQVSPRGSDHNQIRGGERSIASVLITPRKKTVRISQPQTQPQASSPNKTQPNEDKEMITFALGDSLRNMNLMQFDRYLDFEHQPEPNYYDFHHAILDFRRRHIVTKLNENDPKHEDDGNTNKKLRQIKEISQNPKEEMLKDLELATINFSQILGIVNETS